MSDIEEIRQFAETIDPKLPKDKEYNIIAKWALSDSEKVAGPIRGKYHAQYVRDRLAEEKGHMGLSFTVKPA